MRGERVLGVGRVRYQFGESWCDLAGCWESPCIEGICFVSRGSRPSIGSDRLLGGPIEAVCRPEPVSYTHLTLPTN